MKKQFAYSLSAFALMVGSPALAEINADQLWTLWQDRAQGMGYTMSADAADTGNGLTLTNVTNTVEVDGMTITANMGAMSMANQADGSVAITMDGPIVYTLSGFDGHDTPDSLVLTLMPSGFAGVASGSAEQLQLDVTLAALTLSDIAINGGTQADIPEIDATLDMAGLQSNYSYDFTNPDMVGISGSSTLASFAFALDMAGPAGGGNGAGNGGGVVQKSGHEEGQLSMALSMMGLSSTGEAMLPSSGNWIEMETMPAGFAVSGEGSYESASGSFSFADSYENFAMDFANQGGSFGAEMSDQAIAYALAASQPQMSIVSGDLPVPIAYSANAMSFEVMMPVEPAATPSPFNANLTYEALSVDDAAWNMFDPSGLIPRDPSDLRIDLHGTAQVNANIMTTPPEEMPMMPYEPRTLEVREVFVSFGGAELGANGMLNFAPNMMFPMPVGTIDLQLSGINGLLQSLGSAGILGPQEAAMAAGMLGAVAVPGAMPDTYTSTIEFTPNGGILANGFPLQ